MTLTRVRILKVMTSGEREGAGTLVVIIYNTIDRSNDRKKGTRMVSFDLQLIHQLLVHISEAPALVSNRVIASHIHMTGQSYLPVSAPSEIHQHLKVSEGGAKGTQPHPMTIFFNFT